jgi:hypothetical protein
VDYPQEQLVKRARLLRFAGSALEIVAIVASIAGVIAGGAIAGHVRITDGAVGGKTHPYLAAGITVIVAVVLLGALSWCVARFIGVYASDVAARQGVDITEGRESRLPEFLQR